MAHVDRLARRPLASVAALAAALLAACSPDRVAAPPAPSAAAVALERMAARDGGALATLDGAATARVEPARVPDRQRFNITLRFVNAVTPKQHAVFEAAAHRWERIIVRDVPATEGTIPADYCGLPGVPAFTGTIDDVLIDVVLQPIDGPGNILGAAGPCAVRTADNLTAYGIMFFDVDDLAFLDSYGLFDETITHEMGHVLGFGTLWNYERTLLTGAGTTNPWFIGSAASAFYRTVGGTTTSVPVENVGGPGTADSHWRERVFGNELMTGYINLGSNPLSTVTAASMIDLGYGAVPNGDPYHLPPEGGVTVQRAAAPAGVDMAARERIFRARGSIAVAP